MVVIPQCMQPADKKEHSIVITVDFTQFPTTQTPTVSLMSE